MGFYQHARLGFGCSEYTILLSPPKVVDFQQALLLASWDDGSTLKNNSEVTID
jgi:hypothetical protein